MKQYFKQSFFKKNRQALRASYGGSAPIVLAAHGQLQRTADSTYPFRQDSNFWYVTGLNEPDLILLMHEDKEYLVLPSRSASRDTFDGSLNADEIQKTSGIDNIVDEDEGWERIKQAVGSSKAVATLQSAPAI